MDVFIYCCREHFNTYFVVSLKRSIRFCEQKQNSNPQKSIVKSARQSIGLTLANFHTCDFLSPTCKATFRGRSRRDTFYHLLKRSHIWSPGHHNVESCFSQQNRQSQFWQFRQLLSDVRTKNLSNQEQSCLLVLKVAFLLSEVRKGLGFIQSRVD